MEKDIVVLLEMIESTTYQEVLEKIAMIAIMFKRRKFADDQEISVFDQFVANRIMKVVDEIDEYQTKHMIQNNE